ncbi:MAG: copper transporter [Actinomycetota bacterium]|nr:copper transporter [Actinomycetota bacterium]
MIDFRYHLVSIVAVFLALAIGIVLGSTELQGTTYNVLDRTTAKLQGEYNQTRGQLATAQAQANEGEAYAQAVEPAVLRDLLPGQRLLIVTEPGAPSAVISGITSAAADAGASVTGQISLQPTFFDTSGTSQDSLVTTTQDVARQAGITLTTTGSYQQQAIQVIASQILVKSPKSAAGQSGGSQSGGSQSGGSQSGGSPSGGSPSGSSPSGSSPSGSADQATNAQTMLAAYAQGGFLNTTGQPATQASLVVVVTPQNVPADGSADPLAELLPPIVQELAGASSATAVAGSSAGSAAGSPIAVLRSNNVANQVSTVDDADLASGQSVVIQALAISLAGGKASSFGFAGNGASAVAPAPAPTPSASVPASVSATVTSPAKKKAKS